MSQNINWANQERDEPVLLCKCPLGHTPSYCIEKPCDRRKQCKKDKVINPAYDFADTPFLRSCRMNPFFAWEH